MFILHTVVCIICTGLRITERSSICICAVQSSLYCECIIVCMHREADKLGNHVVQSSLYVNDSCKVLPALSLVVILAAMHDLHKAR